MHILRFSFRFLQFYITSVITNNAALRIRETTLEPEVALFLTPHATVRILLVCFVSVQGSFHFVYTLHSREIKEKLPLNCISFVVLFYVILYSETRVLFKFFKRTSHRNINAAQEDWPYSWVKSFNLCAFYHNSFFDVFQSYRGTQA